MITEEDIREIAIRTALMAADIIFREDLNERSASHFGMSVAEDAEVLFGVVIPETSADDLSAYGLILLKGADRLAELLEDDEATGEGIYGLPLPDEASAHRLAFMLGDHPGH